MAVRARTLKEALNLFDPRVPLSGRALAAYYVERPDVPTQELKAYLEAMDEPVKVLFSGHRGSGKSTELNRLTGLLKGRFFIVHFSVLEILNLTDLTYVDLILAIALRLLQQATDERVLKGRKRGLVGMGMLEDLYRWLTHEIVEEEMVSPSREASAEAALNLLALKLEGRVKTESSTRRMVRERAELRLFELVSRTNRLIEEIRSNARRPVLVVVEDLDKLSFERAMGLFLNHAALLAELRAHILFTFPIALRYAREFLQIRNHFSERFIVPNVMVYDRHGQLRPEGHRVMREMVERRVEPYLIDPEAIDLAVRMSGGIPLTLIQLVQSAILHGLAAGQDRIGLPEMRSAVIQLQNDYRGTLRPEDYGELLRYHRTRTFINNERTREFLASLSLLEYSDGEPWCDVHPILLPLLGEP
ncbi:hypothetical protein [Thermoflexus sp.]|uniref:hypothetical protein n=1 Tax=Thermoflexus sp. TaxID=1969742 RepID=UPI0035E436E8